MNPGTDDDFLNIFAVKFVEKLAFLTKNKAKLCKKLIITLISEKNAKLFCRKSQKIVITKSTPRLCVLCHDFCAQKPILRLRCLDYQNSCPFRIVLSYYMYYIHT
jgi:hypothetical protein